MGGEKYSVLIYGPRKEYMIDELVSKFNLINQEEWVKNFIKNEKHDYKFTKKTLEKLFEGEQFNFKKLLYSEKEQELYKNDDYYEGVFIIYTQEFVAYNEGEKILLKFLKENKLAMVYDNNICWDTCFIGMVVTDYNLFTESQKEVMKKLCVYYNLPEPTFYAGITGEL